MSCWYMLNTVKWQQGVSEQRVSNLHLFVDTGREG